METNSSSYEVVLEALQLSHTSHNNQQISQATHIIQTESMKPGYIPILVTIINDTSSNQNLAYAALLQLKNVLRYRWKVKQKSQKTGLANFTDMDRQYLISRLIQTNINHVNNYNMFKIIKDVNYRVADSIGQIIPDICRLLQEQLQLKPCLNILLGVSQYYRLQNSQRQRLTFMHLLQTVVPLVLSLVHKGQQKILQLYNECNDKGNPQALVRNYNKSKAAFEEILYMSIKFAYKSICSEFQVSLRQLYCQWAVIAQNRLNEEKKEVNQYAKQHPNFCGNRGTSIFNYFHGKKWSAKFLIKFLQKLLITKKSQPQFSIISVEYISNNAILLKQSVHQIFAHCRPNNVRFFELYLMQQMFRLLPQLMQTQIRYYLFQVLPKLLCISGQDLDNLQNNPEEFMISESYVQKNVKTYATSIWCNLALFDSSKTINLNRQVQEGKYIIQSYRQIQNWLLQQNWRSQEIAIYLMAHSGLKIIQFRQTISLARQILSLCIPTIFDQPLLILQVRGFQLIQNFPSIIQKSMFPIIQEIILNVFQLRAQTKKFDILAIYSGIALQKVIYYGLQTNRAFTSEQIQLILSTLLQLIKTYELSQLSKTLVVMIEQYSQEMSAFSIQLVGYMCKIVKQIIEKELTTKIQQNTSNFETAVDVLIIMSRIATQDQYFNRSLKQTLENQLVQLLNFVLTYQEQLSSDCLANLLQILSSFIDSQTNAVQVLPNLLFKIAPPNINIINNIQVSQLSQEQKLLLNQSTKTDELGTQHVFELFRNYLKFIDPKNVTIPKAYAQIQDNLFNLGLLNQFLYMLYYFYKPFRSLQIYTICKGRYMTTVLLITILEHHHKLLPLSFYLKVFAIIKVNMKSKKIRRTLNSSNMQLFCIWICSYQHAIEYILKNKQDLLSFVFNIFVANKDQLRKMDNELHTRRIVLGMAQLIRFGFNYPELIQIYQFLFTWIFYYITRSLASKDEQQILLSQMLMKEKKNQASQGQFSFFNQQYNDSESDFYIDQTYNEHYQSKSTFNQLDYFLETLLYLQQYDRKLYDDFVLKPHYYSLKTIYKQANLNYVSKYRNLLKNKPIIQQIADSQ